MIKSPIYRFDKFDDGQVLHNKKKGHLPAMGWNSWNAFGSGNTEALTKAMTDKLIELGLADLGYKYVVLDDGCYKPERVDGLLSNEEIKFPSGFRALADYIHAKGLKFGMYNDIGTNLCAGAAVGTCGHEREDAATYLSWGVDFLKVDNCYYLWDNATFSDPTNAKYVFAPKIRKIILKNPSQECTIELNAVADSTIWGERIVVGEDCVTHIGSFDGTGPDRTPVGIQSGELRFNIDIPEDGEYTIAAEYATGEEEGIGSFMQIALGEGDDAKIIYDDFVARSESQDTFITDDIVEVHLEKGNHLLRIMNHRRQENTLGSYGILVEELNRANPDNDIIFSICEWGKTSPQNWGYKVGDSWRILNDITFSVGADGEAGNGAWESDYTTSVAAQYNKAVIMDEYAGITRGWNDPDMMMIGMRGLDETMCKTHMTMWCMMNSPLMLGLDLRRVTKGDALWKIIANKNLIMLNQDGLGVQAKRIYSTLGKNHPDREYIRDNHRVDVLAKPLADGSVALSFINMDKDSDSASISILIDSIIEYIGDKMLNADEFAAADEFVLTDLWDESQRIITGRVIESGNIAACDNVTVRISVNR